MRWRRVVVCRLERKFYAEIAADTADVTEEAEAAIYLSIGRQLQIDSRDTRVCADWRGAAMPVPPTACRH